MNKARMTFRFDGKGQAGTHPSEPLWDPVNGQPMEQGGGKEQPGELKTEDSSIPKPHLEVVRTSEQDREQKKLELKHMLELEQKPKEKRKPRRYADMNAAISNWPEEDVGNPFQAHSGLGMYGYPEPQYGGEKSAPVIHPAEEQEWDARYDREQRFSGAEEGQGSLWSSEPVHHRPPSRSSRWKVIGSVTGAVVTGALFGMVVLSLFNKEVEFPIPGLAAITESAQKAVDSLPAVGDLKQEEVSSSAAVQVNLPAQDYFFLQYGVFSSPDGVQRAQQELQDAGYAAAQDTLDDKRVYAAISADREQAKLLSSEMKAEGVDLILHEASIPADASIRYSLESGTFERYAQQSAELVKLLSETSASLLLDQAPELSASLITELKDKHVQFTQSAAAVRNGFGGDDKQLIQNMETEMNSAVEALLQFDKTKAKSHLWEVQNSMMRYVLDEQQLFQQN